MFTKEQLAKWRAMGFQFNSFYDKVAVDKKEYATGTITNLRIVSRGPYKFGSTIEIEITTKDLQHQNVILKLQMFDDDSELGHGKDTLLYETNVSVTSDIIKLKIPLSDKHQSKAFGAWEGDYADCYFKVSYQRDNHQQSIESPRIQIKFNKEMEYGIFMEQYITSPAGTGDFTHRDSVLVLNSKSQTIAFIAPDEKLFLWVEELGWRGYFLDGQKAFKNLYDTYIDELITQKTEPFSWGIYLAGRDSGQFVIDLVEDPKETLTGLAKALKKIVTLDFDIEAIWERIQEAKPSDATYVVSCILMGRLASVPSKVTIKGVRKIYQAIPKKDLYKLAEIVEYYAQVNAIRPITWAELLVIFKRALEFEARITQQLLKKFPISQNYLHIERLYLKVNGAVSVADNCIYNTNTKQWMLNETKYGISNVLTKNQQVIDRAIKAGVELEIRSASETLMRAGIPYKQGDQILISEIYRSHSWDGIIKEETIKLMWKK